MFLRVRFFIISLLVVLGVVATLGPVTGVQAQYAENERERQLEAAGGTRGAGLTATDPRFIVVNIIRVLLSIVGVLIFCYMFYAGYLWMTAGGNEDNVEKAKGIIKHSIMGLLVVLCAFAIMEFIVFYAKWSVSGDPYGRGGPTSGYPRYY